jgi:hypothetical protein
MSQLKKGYIKFIEDGKTVVIEYDNDRDRIVRSDRLINGETSTLELDNTPLYINDFISGVPITVFGKNGDGDYVFGEILTNTTAISGTLSGTTLILNDTNIDLSSLDNKVISGSFSYTTKQLSIDKSDNTTINIDLSSLDRYIANVDLDTSYNMIFEYNNLSSISVNLSDLNKVVTSAELDNNTLKINRNDGIVIPVNLESINKYIVSGVGNENGFILNRNDGETFSVDLGTFSNTIKNSIVSNKPIQYQIGNNDLI